MAALEAKREELIGKGRTVADVVDHEWAKSIYFKNPNGISLKFCCVTRDVGNLDHITSNNVPNCPRKNGWKTSTSTPK